MMSISLQNTANMISYPGTLFHGPSTPHPQGWGLAVPIFCWPRPRFSSSKSKLMFCSNVLTLQWSASFRAFPSLLPDGGFQPPPHPHVIWHCALLIKHIQQLVHPQLDKDGPCRSRDTSGRAPAAQPRTNERPGGMARVS